MRETCEAWVPDVFPSFSCKCGECRHTCCQQWKISLSLAEYQRLIGLPLDAELRRTLDGAFYPVERPTEQRYATLYERPDGFCKMLLPSGYCALHRTCGEEVLPRVCRLYPRSPRCRFAYECSASLGCEAAVEAMLASEKPLSFVKIPLPGAWFAEEKDASVSEEDYLALRFRCFAVMAHEMPLIEKLRALAKELLGADRMTEENQSADAYEALTFARTLSLFYQKNSASLREYAPAADSFYGEPADSDPEKEENPGDLLFWIDEDAYQNRAFLPTPDAAPCPDPAVRRYRLAHDALLKEDPAFDAHLSRILTHHMFYSVFPFASETREDAMLSLLAAASLVCYVVTGALTGSHPDHALADVIAGVFRMIEGSPFIETAPAVLRRAGMGDWQKALSMASFW